MLTAKQAKESGRKYLENEPQRVMEVLIACEESQVVCKSFRSKGHNAYSCDIIECSGGHPEWHLREDIKVAIFRKKWDLVIAHPPCTYLCNSGVRWLKGNPLRFEKMLDASQFFKNFIAWHNDGYIGTLAIENPIPHKHAKLPKYTQIIHPYQFGCLERKSTCLWLYGLPPLISTNNVYSEMMKLPKRERERIFFMSPSPERSKLRSKTYEGIASAMAEQWGDILVDYGGSNNDTICAVERKPQ